MLGSDEGIEHSGAQIGILRQQLPIYSLISRSKLANRGENIMKLIALCVLLPVHRVNRFVCLAFIF